MKEEEERKRGEEGSRGDGERGEERRGDNKMEGKRKKCQRRGMR